MTSSYQVSSRRYRPKVFAEVLGQDAVVTVLKNALAMQRTAHAYLFAGIRGTGKTTLARLFAKALNCKQLTPEFEPCNQCACCREVSSGTSLDVIEIDGASHRGIEDIRQINETVFFVPAKSKYKVYIIDEVHMLTKEAFNSLLKTLEEPPQHVKFFFATTEMYKVPRTILSRCQKMVLSRVSEYTIVTKLLAIAQDQSKDVNEDVLLPIARAAQGSLRDAESLYDYVVGLFPEILTAEAVSRALGFVSRDLLETLVTAVWHQECVQALACITQALDSGVAPISFLHDLTLFYRDLLIEGSNGYSEDHLLEIIDFLGEASKYLQQTAFEKTFLETVVVHLIRICGRPSLESLVSRWTEASVGMQTKPKLSTINEPAVNPVSTSTSNAVTVTETAKIDTLLQFAVVEFSGVLIKEPSNG